MDMSFALQCLSCEYVALHSDKLTPKAVTDVPTELDRQVAFIKLAETGYRIDTLSEEQKAYLASW